MPKTEDMVYFKNYHKGLAAPFVIYACFEAITEKVDRCQPKNDKSYTESYQKHKDSHISTNNQQLDFPNFHCSVVCSYCSIWCLIRKSGSKMVKISNASYENEIHRVESPFNEDSKI